MMHVSIPVKETVEMINFTQVSPLISKCQIKVCYVSDQPNRNGSIITKEVATEMGKKLPGSPIVGYFNEKTGDYEEHSRKIEITNSEFAIIDLTKPYGFVPTDAKVWFQKFIDDGKIEREYLCTEGYIWDSAYPEAKRIVEQGNNQSMELNGETLKGSWTESDNSNASFFIINEALIEKICILGEDFEPCFEGSQIKAQFSLIQEFEQLKNAIFSMQKLLEEGGLEPTMNENIETQAEETEVIETEETQVEEEVVVTEEEEEFAKKKEEEPEDNSEESEDDDDEDKKDYALEEIPEYVELNNKYSALVAEHEAIQEELNTLREFKANKDKADKQAMIDKFFMLSDEDKKDVVENIDKYSVEDIEAKLAVICFRLGVSFDFAEEEEKDDTVEETMNFSLTDNGDDSAPDWIKAVKRTQNKD